MPSACFLSNTRNSTGICHPSFPLLTPFGWAAEVEIPAKPSGGEKKIPFSYMFVLML